jgi:hypothetical protein
VIDFSALSFGDFDGKHPDVMACCDENYSAGCVNATPGFIPQQQDCLKDCAFQLCRKFATEYLEYINDKFENDEDVEIDLKVLKYVNTHTTDCQKALLQRTNCDEIAPTLCDDEYDFVGRWYFEQPEFEWTFVEQYKFEGFCQFFFVDDCDHRSF